MRPAVDQKDPAPAVEQPRDQEWLPGAQSSAWPGAFASAQTQPRQCHGQIQQLNCFSSASSLMGNTMVGTGPVSRAPVEEQILIFISVVDNGTYLP